MVAYSVPVDHSSVLLRFLPPIFLTHVTSFQALVIAACLLICGICWLDNAHCNWTGVLEHRGKLASQTRALMRRSTDDRTLICNVLQTLRSRRPEVVSYITSMKFLKPWLNKESPNAQIQSRCSSSLLELRVLNMKCESCLTLGACVLFWKTKKWKQQLG